MRGGDWFGRNLDVCSTYASEGANLIADAGGQEESGGEKLTYLQTS